MIDYSQYKRFYAQPGLFYTLTGDYTGYVQILSGIPYIDGTTSRLSLSSTFETSLATSTYFKNRTISETSSLPYTEKNVLFEANDFLTERLFKDKLTKLHDNNTYIYSRFFLANNDIPYNNAITYGYVQDKNSITISISTGYSGSIPFRQNNLSQIKALGDLINLEALKKETGEDDYVIFGITTNQFVSITGNNSNIGIVEVSPYYETDQNVLPFKSLGGITVGGNYLFITDTGSNAIIKYDIAGYINGDAALGNKRNLIEIIGGEGPATLKTKFRSPKEIASNGKLVVVHDVLNTVLKIFDIKFNYHGRITTIPLKKQPLAGIQFDPHYGLLHALTYNTENNGLNLYIYDLSGANKRPVLVNKVENIGINLVSGEIVQNIEFSKSSSEYYYVCTNKSVYKLHVSIPNSVIGRYQETKLFNTETSTVNDTRVITLTSAPVITIIPPTTFTNYTIDLFSTPDIVTTVSKVIDIPEIRTTEPAVEIFQPSYTRLDQGAYKVVTPPYTIETPILVNASNRWSVVPIKFNEANWIWNGTYQVPDIRIDEIPEKTTYFPAITTQIAASNTSISARTVVIPATQVTVPASVTVVPGQNFTRVQEVTSTIPGVSFFEPGEPYRVVEAFTKDVKTQSMFNDSYRGISILPTNRDIDKIIFLTDARIYFYEERNTYKQIIKGNNLQNFGITNIYTNSEEYIQASTINKELYKVTRDIFTLKNNLVGRFDGTYDNKAVFTLKDYNYNIDFNSFTVLEEEDYSVHENERSILGVINRALSNILKLQENLLEFTIPDTGSSLKPVFNPSIADSKALIID